MRSFFLVYGTFLLLVSVAFSYFESRSKSQRIIEAKVVRAHQLVQNQNCEQAFHLLTQYKQPALSSYYEQKTPGQVQALKTAMCKALEDAQMPKDQKPVLKRVNDPQKDYQVYKVELTSSSPNSKTTLTFSRKLGELIVTKVES